MTKIEAAANRIYPILRDQKPQGTAEEVAELCGVHIEHLRYLARLSRTAKWIEEHGWKIDYRGHGAKRNLPWTISHVDDPPSLTARASATRMRESTERKIRSAAADCSVWVEQTVASTLEGKKARQLARTLQYAAEIIELEQAVAAA